MWLCTISGLGLTFVSQVDDSDPVAGVDCKRVTVASTGVPRSRWNAFNQLLKLLLDLGE